MSYIHDIKVLIDRAQDALGLPKVAYKITKPTHITFGDYATNIALVLSREQRVTGADKLANAIVLQIRNMNSPLLEKIEAVNGFINFYLSREALGTIISNVISLNSSYCAHTTKDTRIHIVEYSSPNIAKPFTIGHLRSTIIGASIAHILSHTGHAVVRDNHLGDWGTQFGKMIVAIKRWGNEQILDSLEDPIKELVALYQRFHTEAENGNTDLEDEARSWFVKLEDGDEEARRIWNKCVTLSMVEFSRIYQQLGVSFDTYYGESNFGHIIPEVITDLQKHQLLTVSDDAQLVFFDEKKKLPPLMILKKDGSTLYATRDLATDRFRIQKYGADVVIINEVGKEQTEYFKQIFEVERMLKYFGENQRYHIAHGHYRFSEGKMSTREGNVIWLDNVLDQAIMRVQTLCKEGISADDIHTIAIGAIKFNDLYRAPGQDIVFDWNTILNLKGDSGPYLQYTVVRITSLLTKADFLIGENKKAFTLLEATENELALARTIEKFEQVIERASTEFAPHYVAGYLIELARVYNSYYAKTHIISNGTVHMTGYTLSQAVKNILTLGLSLLGIGVPQKM